jgi:hypothetical protein
MSLGLEGVVKIVAERNSRIADVPINALYIAFFRLQSLCQKSSSDPPTSYSASLAQYEGFSAK